MRLRQAHELHRPPPGTESDGPSWRHHALRPSGPAPDRSPHPSAATLRDSASIAPHNRASRQAAVLGATALVAAGAVGPAVGWTYAPVAAWGAVSAVYLFKVWRGIGGMGARQTARHARQDDPGRAVMDLMLLAAALASVVDVVYVLAASRTMSASARSIHAVGAVVSVALTWTVVHTLFTLRYARLFHQHRCGLDFNSPLSPTYRDFAYVAFTVGMTYQVSDTTTMTAAIRREVLRHALLSYVFGTFVLASVVNLLVGLVA